MISIIVTQFSKYTKMCCEFHLKTEICFFSFTTRLPYKFLMVEIRFFFDYIELIMCLHINNFALTPL